MTATLINLSLTELKLAKELLFDPFDLELKNLNIHSESQDYAACSFELNGKKIEYRASKITPVKIGQFVTTWRRDKEGITRPFDSSDDLDFLIISSRNEDNFGLFIFPKSILAGKGIISQNGEGGKRGIRVYPTWDQVTNKQAEKTQRWQSKYFLWIKNTNPSDHALLQMLLN